MGRWATDWHNGAIILASVMVALISFVIIDGALARREARQVSLEAIKAAQAEVARGLDARQASSARISQLQDRITDLTGSVQEANRLAGESAAREEALAQQIRNLGARPVVIPRHLPPVVVTMPPARPEVPPPTSAPSSTTSTTTTTTTPVRPHDQPTTTTTRPKSTTTSTTTTTIRR